MAEDAAPMAVGEPEVVDLEAAAAKVKEGKGLIDDDPEKAVELLCAAVRSYEKHYGSEAIECAPVYMYYGIALYEVARGATDALGTTKTTVEPIPTGKLSGEEAQPPAADAEAGNGDATGSTDEVKATPAAEPAALEGGDGQATAPAAEPAPAEEGAPKPATEEDGPAADDADKGAAKAAGAEADGEEAAADGDGEEGDEEGNEEEEEEEGGDGGAAKEKEDASSDDMKLAWDMLELSRIIYSRSDPAQHHERLAEVHKALGDIKSEEEFFEEAVECYKQSLHHLESMQPRNSRRLAEVQYKLAQVLTYVEQPEEALQVTNAAVASLATAIAETEEKLAGLPTDGSGGEEAEEEGRRLQAVSDDLRGVVSELQCNADGLKETIANNNSLKEALRQAFLKANGGGADGAAGTEAVAAALAAAGSKLPNAFSAPSNPGAAAQAVSLGTVGRGSKRITLQPANTNTAPVSSKDAVKAATAASSKRTLDDLMGGTPSAAGGVTTSGFGAVAVVEKREEAGVQQEQQQEQLAKKARTEAAAGEVAAVGNA